MNKILSMALMTALSLSVATPASTKESKKPTSSDARMFVAKVNDRYMQEYPEVAASEWVSSTYINDDTQMIAANANARWLTALSQDIEASWAFKGVPMDATTKRAIKLLRMNTSMPAPKDPTKLKELTNIASKLGGMYGAGKYCTGEGNKQSCRNLGDLEAVLRQSRDYDTLLEAWRGWRTVAPAMRKDYQRFAELTNEGASIIGHNDTGAMWRSGYDMSAAQFRDETDRLWKQVEPLYQDLQCYARGKMEAKYGEKGSRNGMIPAHLTGNMWAQSWGNRWDLLAPYPKVAGIDVTAGLAKQKYTPEMMVRRAEDFYTSLGMPKLPESFWTKSQFTKPQDREVVCHASAWDIDYRGDVRIKMCIKPNATDFSVIYHELGHIYYYLAYNHLPPLFQSGAHDGFHEAIGDTIVLAMTPGYLNSIGLIKSAETSKKAVINAQMAMALEKVAFLPFGKLIDEWRWGVFDGSIQPNEYNKAWWDLREKYQGVTSAAPRGEEHFDPGAKYHVPGNTPYARYFLAHVLQFQFYRALCDAADHQGPLHECSFYGNQKAGKLFWNMMQRGQSQPWQQTMKEMTGQERMDASALIDYFAPLSAWLKEQNEGKQCGWGK